MMAMDQLLMLENYGAIHETDGIEKRLTILIALFDSIEPKTAEGFRRQLEIIHEYGRF